MKKFYQISIPSLVIGVIATVLVLIDSFIAPLIVKEGSFTWVAFINWTVFFSSSINERIRAFIGLIIGFISANLMITIGNLSFNFNIFNISLMTLVGTFLINALVMYLTNAKKLYLNSINGIFVGIALTFAKCSTNIQTTNLKLLLIILIYGILGLLCGFFTNILTKKLEIKK